MKSPRRRANDGIPVYSLKCVPIPHAGIFLFAQERAGDLAVFIGKAHEPLAALRANLMGSVSKLRGMGRSVPDRLVNRARAELRYIMASASLASAGEGGLQHEALCVSPGDPDETPFHAIVERDLSSEFDLPGDSFKEAWPTVLEAIRSWGERRGWPYSQSEIGQVERLVRAGFERINASRTN